MQSALPGFETNSWREQRAPPYRESPWLIRLPPSAPGHPSQTSLMAGGIAGAGGEFPSVLGRCFLHTKINHRITCALTCSEKAAANLSDQREFVSVLPPGTSASCCSVCLATAKTQKSKSAAVGLEQSLLSPGATWGDVSAPRESSARFHEAPSFCMRGASGLQRRSGAGCVTAMPAPCCLSRNSPCSHPQL